MVFLAFPTDLRVVRRLLDHLRIPTDLPVLAPARCPFDEPEPDPPLLFDDDPWQTARGPPWAPAAGDTRNAACAGRPRLAGWELGTLEILLRSDPGPNCVTPSPTVERRASEVVYGRIDLARRPSDNRRGGECRDDSSYGLFRFMASIEKLATQPPFQYIVTTTTEPRAEFKGDGYVVARLEDNRPEGRLLGRAL